MSLASAHRARARLQVAARIAVTSLVCVISPVAAQSPPPPATPRVMPYTSPDASALGALPDGVGVPIGQLAPDASLHDASGAPVTLRDLYAKGPTLLIFYRGGWCPFCNTQIRDLTEVHALNVCAGGRGAAGARSLKDLAEAHARIGRGGEGAPS
jgi:hypothetical protein